MFPSRAANDPAGVPNSVRIEAALELRGRPCVLMAWFSRPEPEVGLPRPQLVGAIAVDVDGEIYDDLDHRDLVAAQVEALRERAARAMGV